MTRSSNYDAVAETVDRFVNWLSRHGYFSHDPYDILGTRFGVKSRRLYYQSAWAGVPLVGPMVLIEMFCPWLRTLLVKKERFATADAQIALAFLNVYALTGDKAALTEATTLCEALIDTSIPGYSGYCWGYPFDWQNSMALWRRNTPYITTVPYGFEAFLALYEVTGNGRYFDAAKSVANFVYTDLRDTPVSAHAAAASYSPMDSGKVINASAYRAFVLFKAASTFAESQYLDKAEKNLNFVLEAQRDDGSWLYALDSPQESFIDHFHTCFVLKNLFKINQILGPARVREALKAGYAYYREHLFCKNGLPKSFSVEPRRQVTRLELYSVAEAITLGVLFRDEIPTAYDVALDLGLRVGREFQLPDGHFVTRIYLGGLRHKMPFLRWPQAQMFYALSNLLLSEKGRETRRPEAAFASTVDDRNT